MYENQIIGIVQTVFDYPKISMKLIISRKFRLNADQTFSFNNEILKTAG